VVEIGLLHSQPFTNSHFHLHSVVELAAFQMLLNDFSFHFYDVRNLTWHPFYFGVDGEDLWMFWASNFKCFDTWWYSLYFALH